MSNSHEEEIRLLRAALRHAQSERNSLEKELEAARKELSRQRRRAQEAWDQLRLLRSSLSWKSTAPLRRVTHR